MLLKSRKAKKSSRGIYLQDRELGDTVFQPGTHFKYVVDVQHKQIVILSAEEAGNTVSKRNLTGTTKPVIDVRSKEALAAFDGCQYLQVEIFEDQVVVSGYDAHKSTLASKVKRSITKVVSRSAKVFDISDFLCVQKRAELVLSKKDLARASGDFKQLPLFSLDELDSGSTSVRSIKAALNQLHIALQVDSLFSGAGFLDLGFQHNGFTIAFAVEKDANAVATYRHNLGDHIVAADIKDIDKSRFQSPVMIGGSPCMGFSNSNRYTNFLDNPNNLLVRQYIESVQANSNCQVFVLENVPQILSAGNGQFKNEILRALSDFEITYGVLNAADYGSPQIRKRAIFIGSKIGRIELPKPAFSPHSYRTVRSAFEGLDESVPNQTDVSQPKPLTRERIAAVPPGGNVHDIPEDIRPCGTHSDMYKRVFWDEPSITIVNPRKAMLLHPEENRILSVRECARLQGVHDSFVFQGDLSSKQQQVANGVPVPLGSALARVVKNAILMFNIKHRRHGLGW